MLVVEDEDKLPSYITELEDKAEAKKIQIASAWPLWVSIVAWLLSAAVGFWAFKRDKRDEIVYDKVRSKKRKLLVGLFLQPIKPIVDPSKRRRKRPQEPNQEQLPEQQ